MGHIYISKDNILHSQKSPRTTPTESFLEVASVVFLVLWFIRTLKIIFTKNPFHFVFRGMGFFYLCLASPKTISVQVSHTLPPLTINKTNCVFCLLLVEPFPVWFGLEFSLGGGGKDFLRLFFSPLAGLELFLLPSTTFLTAQLLGFLAGTNLHTQPPNTTNYSSAVT